MPRPTDNPYGERLLKFAAPVLKGLDVWDLQIKLIGWGSGTDNDGIGNVLDPVRVTGTFDAATRDAVMRFQKAHALPIDGIVNVPVFHAIDREAALHPILMHHLKCPCVHGANDGPILCRCTKHPDGGKAGKCEGFGKGRFGGKFLLDGVKLADGTTDLGNEKLDLYDMQEYKGMDKAVLWALRALMHRAELKVIRIQEGYRCWLDNYHHADDIRWRHRRSTFHFGKAVEFYTMDPGCTQGEWKDAVTHCPECEGIRKKAVAKCGFQLRWQEENRVSVAEVSKAARPPATPFSVHVDTVRRLERKDDEFVKSDADAEKPRYGGKLNAMFFPVDLGSGYDPRIAASQPFFLNTESGPGGWFPLGKSRLLHGGVHLYVGAGTKVRAIADGEIVGCRAGDA
ncbi:MAG: peptidoglycan-binding protein, partial [Victivallales bacterium]|nr:peptidoglycan-binding protein [Victivallales bacterium]